MWRAAMIATAAALALAPAAQARKVLNPTDQLDVTATALLIDVGDGHIHQDMTGLSATLLDAARVDASGQVSAPASQAAVPDVPVPDIHGETNGIHYDITSVVLHTTFDEPVTGAIDPFTGAAALHAQLHFRASFTAQAYLASCPACGVVTWTPAADDCTVGDPADDPSHPIVLDFTTGTSNGVTGSGYAEGDGSLRLVDHALVVPALADCAPPWAAAFSDLFLGFAMAQLGLPADSGHNTVAATLRVDPVLRRGVIAALTPSPALGAAPLDVALDASASQVPGGVRSFAFDLDGDGSYETVTGTTPAAAVTFTEPGTRTVGVRIVDADGDTDTARASVTVQPRSPVASIAPSGGGAQSTSVSSGGGLPPADTPIAGVRGVARPLSGQVLVRLPSNPDFVPLEGAASLPVGAVVDARKGSLTFASAVDARGRVQSATLAAGIFQIKQARATGTAAVPTDFVLVTPPGLARACASSRTRPAKGVVRTLSVTATKGVFRTVGAKSVTTARSAAWTTSDRCDGTLTKVRRGHVSVRAARRTVTVRAGGSYLVKARLFAAKQRTR
jgi:hypothetical protein